MIDEILEYLPIFIIFLIAGTGVIFAVRYFTGSMPSINVILIGLVGMGGLAYMTAPENKNKNKYRAVRW